MNVWLRALENNCATVCASQTMCDACSDLHGFVGLLYGRVFVTVFLEHLDTFLSELVAAGLGEDFEVVGLEATLVVNLAALDDHTVNVGA